jgi:PAS domain S-box-containing protein
MVFWETLKRWKHIDHSLPLEEQFFQSVSRLGGLVSLFVILPLNRFQNLGWWVDLVVLVFGVLCLGVTWAAQRGHYLRKTLLVALVSMLDLIWFSNGGSQGSIGLYFFILVLFLVTFFDGAFRVAGLLAVVANIVVLHLAEHAWPQLSHAFLDPADRLVDISSGYVISLLVSAMFLVVVQNGYVREKQNVREAMRALQASEERYRLLIDNAVDEIWTLDLDGRFTFASPSVFRRHGVTSADLLGAPFDRWMTPASQVEARKGLHAAVSAMAHGEPSAGFRCELEERGPGGREIWTDVTATGIRGTDGRFAGIFGITRDITERKRAEADRRDLEARLLQAQKMESVGRLAGGVAHDFNNMLAVILGNAHAALDQLHVNQPLHEMLDEIRQAADRSVELTRQLLAFARRQTIAPRVMDLNTTVGAMVGILQRLVGENVRLEWRPSTEPWKVRMDPSQVDQILANLCANARDAISGVGTVVLETGACTVHAEDTQAPPGEYVLLRVTDDGAGMDAETLEHVFEPFFTTKPQGKGTGLGLATVYGIAQQNGGFIRVESTPGKGSAFSICLPRAVEDVLPAPAAVPGVMGGRETILLVEDDAAVLRSTQRMLEHQGYRVLAADCPGKALSVARDHVGPLHLLLTDVVMPQMNGRDLALTLAQQRPDMKHLFMSGYATDVMERHGVPEGGYSFLQKPFSREQLAARLRMLLDEVA